jgi:hypothetical protein
MLVELKGKAGQLCEPARLGKLHCPLIVRSTSEDVITDHIFRTLRLLNPRWWLPDVLNDALGCNRFRRQLFRKFRIELWQKQRACSQEWLPWAEGRTEVDVVLTWENPETTVFVEMKYGSGLSEGTVHNNGECGFPSDQLIRNIRIGLLECGWFREAKLIDLPLRDFVMILITPQGNHPLVSQYRDPGKVRFAMPATNRLKALPTIPFIGELSFHYLCTILARQKHLFTRVERLLITDLIEYLEFKRSKLGL